MGGLQRAGGAGDLGAGGLQVLGLVVDDALPVHRGEHRQVPCEQRIGRDHQVEIGGAGGEGLIAQPVAAVVDVHRQVGSELRGFALPGADH